MRRIVFRTTDIVLIAVMLAVAAFTYDTKHQAEKQLERIRQLETAVELEKDTIDVLEADWSILTQPSRMQRLSEIYSDQLQLAPVESTQIADIEELPPRPIQVEDLIENGAMADSGLDPTATGGVEP